MMCSTAVTAWADATWASGHLAGDISDGIDARHVGGAKLVDHYTGAVNRHSCGIQAQLLHVGLHAHGHQHHAGVYGLRGPALVHRNGNSIRPGLNASHCRAGHHVDAV